MGVDRSNKTIFIKASWRKIQKTPIAAPPGNLHHYALIKARVACLRPKPMSMIAEPAVGAADFKRVEAQFPQRLG